MDKLPVEVKEFVFNQLDFISREEVGKVSKTWNKIICHLERGQHFLDLRAYKTIDKDEVYSALLRTNRKFSIIKIDLAPSTKILVAYSDSIRIKKVLRKFGRSIKRLEIVNVPIFHLAEFKEFLTKTPLVESLVLSFSSQATLPYFELRMTKLKEFSLLKKVSFKNTPGVASILEMIPANTLEELEIDALSESAISEGKFQKILERQNNIKRVKIELQNVCLRHLTLDTYELNQSRYACQPKLIETLFYQEQLREFKTDVIINTALFSLVTDLINLVTLHVPIDIVKQEDFAKIRKLVNLKNLSITEKDHGMWRLGEFVGVVDEHDRPQLVRVDIPQLSDIVLPTLETLQFNLRFRKLISADYMNLNQNLVNLKELTILGSKLNDLEFAISNFSKLKTLRADFDSYVCRDSRVFMNNALEELRILAFPFYCWSIKRIYESVNSCPNLERLALKVVQLDEHLELTIRRHPQLTHLYVEFPEPAILRFYNEVNSGHECKCEDCSFPVLEQVMNLFKDSPKFKRLSFMFLESRLVKSLQEFAYRNKSMMKLVIKDAFVELVKGDTYGDIHKHFARDINKRQAREQYVI